jgi:hypothetical protein
MAGFLFMQKEIYNTLFDPSKIISAKETKWRIGSDAIIDSSAKPLGDPRIARVSQQPKTVSTVIGGLCSIFTGDLGTNYEKYASNIIRLDQIVEAVGTLPGKPSFIIIEDSFFEKLTGINQNQFQKQGQDAVKRIEKWLNLINPDFTDLYFAFTSNAQLDKGLKDLVNYFANDEIRNPNFAKIAAAPVLLMYTGFWPKLLNSLGFIPSDKVVCIEPINHFVDDRKLPANLTIAYWAFLDWLKDNPYGVSRSANANIGIAGFQESIALDGTQRRSRILPYSLVPNTQNYQDWFGNFYNSIYNFPFPLKNNPIFIAGVNWGIFDPRIYNLLKSLAWSEFLYYNEKDNTPKSQRSKEWSKELKDRYSRNNERQLELLYTGTKQIINKILE